MNQWPPHLPSNFFQLKKIQRNYEEINYLHPPGFLTFDKIAATGSINNNTIGHFNDRQHYLKQTYHYR